MYREYLSQVNTILIIGFLLWRVETLQKLSADETSTPDVEEDDVYKPATIDIGALLQRYCEEPKLYLQHDLTLAQLSEALGTNRTYVSQYFAQQSITYNTYINRLRIEHFEQIYREAVESLRPFTAQQLAYDCGFNSYSTFAAAFKFFNGQTVTAWMKLQ
jgi:AraC-like DNA-binding protein